MIKAVLLSLVLSLSMAEGFAEGEKSLYMFGKVKAVLGEAGTIDPTTNCPECIKELKPQSLYDLYSKDNGQTISLSVISEEELTTLFDELAANEKIPFGYAYDGCYARAHKMSKILEEKGVISGKAFVEGNLKVVSPVLGNVSWWYHVAPVVMVKKNGKEIPYIIDPSLFTKPVPFTEWRDHMTASKKENVNSEYFTNRFSYSPDDKFPPPKTEFSEPVLESMQGTMSQYRTRYNQILKSKTSSKKAEGV